MKATFTVHTISDVGDGIRLEAQGHASMDGEHSPFRSISVTVPHHVGRRYSAGQRMTVTIKPGKKP